MSGTVIEVQKRRNKKFPKHRIKYTYYKEDDGTQMVSKEDFTAKKTLNQRGVYLKDIAEELGIHPKTVRQN
jgi:hypothetical protein